MSGNSASPTTGDASRGRRTPISVIGWALLFAACKVVEDYRLVASGAANEATGREMAVFVGGSLEALVLIIGILAMRWWAFWLFVLEFAVAILVSRADTPSLIYQGTLFVIFLAGTAPHWRSMVWKL